MASFLRRLEQTRLRDAAIKSYLDSPGPHSVHLGAGTNILASWFNSDLNPFNADVHFLDTSDTFPFPDRSVDYVFSEHHLEHLSFNDGQFMLGECARVLRPGGVIRVATPSLEILAELLKEPLTHEQQEYVEFIARSFLAPGVPATPAGVLNNAFREWGHQFLYDRRTLLGSLNSAGFTGAAWQAPGLSEIEQLRGVEGHGAFIGSADMNSFETMVLEASRR